MSKQLIAFKATPSQAEKLKRLASGEKTTVSGILQRLVDSVLVEQIVETNLKFDSTKLQQANGEK